MFDAGLVLVFFLVLSLAFWWVLRPRATPATVPPEWQEYLDGFQQRVFGCMDIHRERYTALADRLVVCEESLASLAAALEAMGPQTGNDQDVPTPREEPVSMYRGEEPFGYEQLVFAADCILQGALDMIDAGLPDCMTYTERVNSAEAAATEPWELLLYERGALDAAGQALSILGAQLTGQSISCYDALGLAANFATAVYDMMHEAWQDHGASFAARKRCRNSDSHFHRGDDIPGYPDTRKAAEEFANVVWNELQASAFEKRHSHSQ